MLLTIIAAIGLSGCAHKAAEGDLSWFTGTWRRDNEKGFSEVIFSPNAAGRLVGVLRIVNDNRNLVLEVISIESTSEGTILLLRHFNSDLIPQEEQPLKFRMI